LYSARDSGAGTVRRLQHFEASRRKFLNEAQVLARVQHSNIVRVDGAFKDNNTAYTVMELLHGETLLRRIERGGALSEAEALSVIEHIGSALKTVHELEMLHLDVKPENIFVCPGDELDSEHRVVLMDFDLLQPMAGPASYRTQPLNATMHCGTPGYAPLEQYTQGTRFGVYTDIYALGATLYHMLFGQPPMDSTDLATRSDTRQADFAPTDGVSSAVQKALKWAMQLQPFKRPQSVADFMDALHGRDVATPDTSPQNTATVLRGGTNNSAKLSLTAVGLDGTVANGSRATKGGYRAFNPDYGSNCPLRHTCGDTRR
jgi:serine/threonine-protein kinase